MNKTAIILLQTQIEEVVDSQLEINKKTIEVIPVERFLAR